MPHDAGLAGPLAAFLGTVDAFSVVVVDERGGVVLVNPAAEALLGWRAEELLGRSVELLVPEARRTAHGDARDAYARAPGGRPMGRGRELEARRKDGSVFPAEVALQPFESGGRRYVAACVVDVTERKRLERAQEDAVSLASHEIRAPMTSISVALSMLNGELSPQLPERARHILRIADRETGRLRRLVDDYLSLSKLESGGTPFVPSRAPLAPLVRHVVEAAQALPGPAGVRVAAELDETAASVVDPDRFTQALANLVSNAVKFSPEGGEVRVRLTRADGRVLVSVRDQGPGIPPEFRARIFQRFQQARHAPEAARAKGSGLGLSIVRAIAERLGGSVGFESEPGRGATFTLTLPAA